MIRGEFPLIPDFETNLYNPSLFQSSSFTGECAGPSRALHRAWPLHNTGMIWYDLVWYIMIWYHRLQPSKKKEVESRWVIEPFPSKNIKTKSFQLQFRRKCSPLPSEKASVKYASYSWRLAHTFVFYLWPYLGSFSSWNIPCHDVLATVCVLYAVVL